MEKQKTKSSDVKSKPQKQYSTVIGSLASVILNVIMLSILSWLFLLFWFGIKTIISNSNCINEVQEIAVTILVSTTKIVLARFFTFIEFLPCLLVILFVFIVDGLVQRDKRKFHGARESALLFHRLKPLGGVSFYGLFFAYMAVPIMLPSTVFLLPMACLTSVFTMLSIKYFKKYV